MAGGERQLDRLLVGRQLDRLLVGRQLIGHLGGRQLTGLLAGARRHVTDPLFPHHCTEIRKLQPVNSASIINITRIAKKHLLTTGF
ncbi:hypothetical protein DPMN_027327 [Dreissena polymorpha]|uniref:Uncharacterized protein n=1 Tax=Dreissena polymorpha TaxID=45954 RepID=A0A9D4LWT1_DREPO|nr:hypothetical protein DPMN_027327 [Dreissena polymorpha]